ncbi:uncharacterized protein Z518_04805 [Rhinocladiella mackenziei CBS 650.93]|uniref:ATP-dependent DNA helicase PIF1 n=1 Tax=Rhinocladiella mackenziei CBS 650.93 TaxID=1442369 RepID=A0A0D2IM47_9EURO|nr:uncharacterized protein Z518_04805 [Rhinocladiella mackenziei CBS 650.93]KIX06829.1 hypothetical protein Z518_04805 [Rhinocladiella mackenziei CBS 650.93]
MSPGHEQRKPGFMQPTVTFKARGRTPRPILPRNLNSQDTPAERDARRRQAAISREHRSIRRGGGEPSPTPNLEELLRTAQTRSSQEGREHSSDEGGHSWVPIFRSRRDFYYGAVSCFRTQFPITNAYTITVHKVQGMTVKKAVLNLTARDFVAGLSYVAVSRIKLLRGILFEEPFDFERFRVRISDTVKSRLADRERRRPEHVGWTEREERDIPLRSSPPPIPSSPMGLPQSEPSLSSNDSISDY